MSRTFTYDDAILDLVNLLGQVPTEIIDQVVFPHASPASKGRQCRHTLQRLFKERKIDRLDRSIGGAGSDSYIWVPAGSERDPKNSTQHSVDIAVFYARLLALEREGYVVVREPVYVEELIPGTRTKFDLLVRLENYQGRRRYFIEIDRGSESTTVISDKMRAYVRSYRRAQKNEHESYPAVVYVVTKARRGRVSERVDSINELAKRQEVPGLFSAYDFDEAINFLLHAEP